MILLLFSPSLTLKGIQTVHGSIVANIRLQKAVMGHPDMNKIEAVNLLSLNGKWQTRPQFEILKQVMPPGMMSGLRPGGATMSALGVAAGGLERAKEAKRKISDEYYRTLTPAEAQAALRDRDRRKEARDMSVLWDLSEVFVRGSDC